MSGKKLDVLTTVCMLAAFAFSWWFLEGCADVLFVVPGVAP